MLYDIVNPSDAYTIEAPDLEIATVACCVLGEGQYAFRPIGDETAQEVPLMMFGGTDEWFQQHFNGRDAGAVIGDVMEHRSADLADCLDSCLIGDAHSRQEYSRALELIESPENREKFRAERHDQRRSSMNDIGGRAYKIAKRLREKQSLNGTEAPKQSFVGY